MLLRLTIFSLMLHGCKCGTSPHQAPNPDSTLVRKMDTKSDNTTTALRSENPPLTPNNGGRSIDGRSLQLGDIIFTSTNSTSSYFIRIFTGGGPASHVAVVSDNTANIIWIIEAVSGGVHKVSLEDFLNHNTNAAAFRYPNLRQDQIANISQYLNNRVGAKYDFFGAGESPFFKFNDRQVEVDYGQYATKKTYCSKLYIEALQTAGISICTLTGGWTSPNDLVTLSWTDNLVYVGHLKYTP